MIATSSTSKATVAQLLSQLADKSFHAESITELEVFLVALSALLVRVIYADGQVTDQEKQRLQKIFRQFIPKNSPLNQLVQSIVKGVQLNKLYQKPSELIALCEALSESERLLLIALGYELAIADGSIDPKERQYLQLIAEQLKISLPLLNVLESALLKQTIADAALLEEVRYQLDPARFQALNPVFAKAADQILSGFPTETKAAIFEPRSSITFDTLATFQMQRQQLIGLCNEIFEVLQSSRDRAFLPEKLEADFTKIFNRIQAQKFRVAVVGEFSQGKSTLLNALLGAEVQPVRAIPCSGVITVLRYGKSKRVICRYKDGREEEIPFEQYQERASISEEAALCNRDDALVQSGLEEIIFEHPDLELCQQGVELIDSPGLNEHPERESITRKLLQDVDAAIFLANASRPLTMGERELLQNLKVQLNDGKADYPASNLFILVNFMDLLRRERDQQQVRQLVENFVYGENIIPDGKNRLHFISAQATIDAILDGEETEYLESFRSFTRSLEQFLTIERGTLEIDRLTQKITYFIKEYETILQQEFSSLDEKVVLSETEKQDILDHVNNFSSIFGKIQNCFSEKQKVVISGITDYWNQGIEQLKNHIVEQSKNWTCTDKESEKIAKHFAANFQRNLAVELETLLKILQKVFIKPAIDELIEMVRDEVEAIQSKLSFLDLSLNSQLNTLYTFSLLRLSDDIQVDISQYAKAKEEDGKAIYAGVGALVAGGLAISAALTAGLSLPLASAIYGGYHLGKSIYQPNQDTLRNEALEAGFKKLNDNQVLLFSQIQEQIVTGFSQIEKEVAEVFQPAIQALTNLLEVRERALKKSLEDREIERIFIQKNIARLTQIREHLAQVST